MKNKREEIDELAAELFAMFADHPKLKNPQLRADIKADMKTIAKHLENNAAISVP